MEASHPELAAYCRWENLSLAPLLNSAPVQHSRRAWLVLVVLASAVVVTVASCAANSPIAATP